MKIKPVSRKEKQIEHIIENLDLFRKHQVDETLTAEDVKAYFSMYYNSELYDNLCSDLGLQPRV